jgi:F-type H+-transporting ATPase subunit delta
MRIKLLANRYAQALFDLALEMKVLEEVEKDMRMIGKVLEENRPLRKVMANPVIDWQKKDKVLTALFHNRVNELTEKFFRLITRKGREAYILFVAESFDEIYKEYKNIMPITITTAYKPDKKVKDAILKKLNEVTDKTLEVTEAVDEDLIGGFKLEFEDYQYDDSIKVQLKRLGNEFTDNLYVSKI